MPSQSAVATRTPRSRGWRPESGVKGDWRGSGFMVRLGDGTDSFGVIFGLGDGHGAWPQLGGWVEQRAAQVLELAQPGGGHGEAAPAAGGAVQDGPDQGEAAGLAGEPADDLDPAAGLAEGSFDEVGGPGPIVVLGGGPQVGGQARPGGEQGLDRGPG